MGKKILGIIGSYRKGGVIDTLVSNDDMKTILAKYKDSDVIVFGALLTFTM
jgi:multimeric flavodoxin WrbA